MSPILTRPVREQFEHDRIIRLLQARYRRKFEVAINLGPEQTTSVAVGEQTVFPDLVLFSQERGHKLQGTVEVETGESVNTLEAMSQWALFSRLRAPFVLYVPPSALDAARRLCAEFKIPVSEIWTYHTALDQVRFTMVHSAPATAARPEPRPAAPAPVKAEVKEAKPAALKPVAAVKPVAVKPAAVKPAAAKPAPKVAAATKTAKPAVKAAAKTKLAPKGAAKKPTAKAVAKPAAKPISKTASKAKPVASAAVKAVKGKAKRR